MNDDQTTSDPNAVGKPVAGDLSTDAAPMAPTAGSGPILVRRRSFLASVFAALGFTTGAARLTASIPVAYPTHAWPPILSQIGPIGVEGPVGMPGLMGPSADGICETEEEHAQRWRDAIEHNRRYFARQNTEAQPVATP